MVWNLRIIFIIIFFLILLLFYINELKKENFINLKKNELLFDNYANIKKNKLIKKSNNSSQDNNYEELEVRILTNNPIYENLVLYVKKYDINMIYNLDNLDLNKPLVITYDNQSVKNKKNESFVNFLNGLNYYKYNFIVCGIDTKWDGWYGRYKIYLELLNKIPENQLLFITDSRDVLVNNSQEEFIKNYNNLLKIYKDTEQNKIIFGTEVGCCVNQMWHYSPGSVFINDIETFDTIQNGFSKKLIDIDINDNNIKLKKSNNNKSLYNLIKKNIIFKNGREYPWTHWKKWNILFKERFIEAMNNYDLKVIDKSYPIIKLNFGMMVGLNRNILKMLQLFDMKPGEDDQHLATEFYYMRPELVILDYTQILLSNTGYKHSFRKCTSKTMNNTKYNINFNDHLNDHDEYVDMNVYTREDIPEQGIMYGFDIENLKYFFTYDDLISFPCFIQSPGKDWNCYNELLYRLPYCDEKMCSYYYNLEQTHKYNIRDIIIHEYKDQNGDMGIKWILSNMLNPLYWSLNLYIIRDIYSIINNDMSNINTFLLLDYKNLLEYLRFKDLKQNIIVPWDEDINLGWYYDKKFTNNIIETFFKNIIKKGYEIFLYYKEKYLPYSNLESDYYTIKINSSNVLQLDNLLYKYEIILFNVTITINKYKEIIKNFNMDINYEEKYLDGNIKIPSVDIYMYELNPSNQTFEYNKLLGYGFPIKIKSKYILPFFNIEYNKIIFNIPNNSQKILEILFNNDINKITNFTHIKIDKNVVSDLEQKLLDEFNNIKYTADNKNIILIIKIYNNFINKYFQIISSNEFIKKIISMN